MKRRNISRSKKRNIARRLRRITIATGPLGAQAQEPQAQAKIRFRLKREIYIATLNVRGMVEERNVKQLEIETWMTKHRIDVCAIQETHVGDSSKQTRQFFTWYYSGGKRGGTIHEGTAFVIKNELLKYVHDAVPINERVQTIIFKGAIPISIITAYAPTAAATDQLKEHFYNKLTQATKKSKSKGFVMVLGDFNARVQTKLSEYETMVGPYTFDKNNTRIEQQHHSVIDNQENLLAYAANTEQRLMNTFFYKQEEKLITYKEDKAHLGGPPYNRSKYETLDYVLVPNRWKNTIKDVESDVHAEINSDHYPMKIRVQINLKAEVLNVGRREKWEYTSCNNEERDRYNNKLKVENEGRKDYNGIKEWIHRGGNQHHSEERTW